MMEAEVGSSYNFTSVAYRIQIERRLLLHIYVHSKNDGGATTTGSGGGDFRGSVRLLRELGTVKEELDAGGLNSEYRA